MGQEKFDNREEFLAFRSKLTDWRFEVATSFDNALLTLSGGALGLSMTFLKDVSENPRRIVILVIAWFSFGLAVLTLLITKYFCVIAYGREMKKWDEQYIQSFEHIEKVKYKTNIWSVLTHTGNFCGLALFIFGLVMIGIFILENI